MDREDPDEAGGADAASARDEVRQMVEAANYRKQRRGENTLDVDAEVERLMKAVHSEDPELRAEIEQVVIANNERRMRRGEDPLDVDEEVTRRLRAFDS